MKVLGIHGIAHTHLTPPEIEAEWLPAIWREPEEAGFSRLVRGCSVEEKLAPHFGAFENRLVHHDREPYPAKRGLKSKVTGQAIASCLLGPSLS